MPPVIAVGSSLEFSASWAMEQRFSGAEPRDQREACLIAQGRQRSAREPSVPARIRSPNRVTCLSMFFIRSVQLVIVSRKDFSRAVYWEAESKPDSVKQEQGPVLWSFQPEFDERSRLLTIVLRVADFSSMDSGMYPGERKKAVGFDHRPHADLSI